MTMPHYLAFVGASVLLVLVPGPDMLYLLARCTAQGRRAGAMAALGSTRAAMFIFLPP